MLEVSGKIESKTKANFFYECPLNFGDDPRKTLQAKPCEN